MADGTSFQCLGTEALRTGRFLTSAAFFQMLEDLMMSARNVHHSSFFQVCARFKTGKNWNGARFIRIPRNRIPSVIVYIGSFDL